MASVHLDVIIETLPRGPRGRLRRNGAAGVGLVLAVLAGLTGGCANPVRRAEHAAERAGFTRFVLPGAGYNHVAFASRGGTLGGPLLVFIEGDGSPWVPGSAAVAADPTSRSPLALALALATPARRVLYLGRPCYLGRAALGECEPSDWTGARYATRIVASLCAAIDHYTEAQPAQAVLLIGVSGGGTLAVLMSACVTSIRGIVTIGANLDVGAWARLHGYRPLDASLDPARTPGVPPAGVAEIHLAGAKDANVPPALLERYLALHPAAELWTMPSFDHVCCWRDLWPALLPRLLARLDRPPDSGR
jgi:hypothetical protein